MYISISPQELGARYGIPVEVLDEDTGGEWAGGIARVGNNITPGKYFAADWTARNSPDLKSVNDYPQNVLTTAHEIAHGLFSRDASRGHAALKRLLQAGVPSEVAFESLVDLGGLYLLESEAITQPMLKSIVHEWLTPEMESADIRILAPLRDHKAKNAAKKPRISHKQIISPEILASH